MPRPRFVWRWITLPKDVLVCKHDTWQRARNFLNFLPQPTHTITRHLHKFHVFSILFAFYGIKKQLARNLVALPREQVDRNFRSVPRFGLNLHSQTWMSFFESFKSNIRCTCSSNSYFPKKSTKWNKLMKYRKNQSKCAKFEYVVPGTVVGLPKNWWPKSKKNCRVPNAWHSAKLPALGPLCLWQYLPSALVCRGPDTRHIKVCRVPIFCWVLGTRQNRLCWVFYFADGCTRQTESLPSARYLALGKVFDTR